MGLSYGAEHRLIVKELTQDLKDLVGPSTVSYAYDKFGRLAQVGSTGCTVPGCPNSPNNVHATYTWDPMGRPLDQSVWTGSAVSSA